MAICLVLIALVISLELVLRKSNKEDGLGNVGDDKYIHYLWTSLPGLVFGILAMIFSNMDSTVRALVPYTMLKGTVTADTFAALDFLDVSVPRAIYREAKLRQAGAFATTTTLLVASFFTIISASLFGAVSFSSISPATLLVNSSFPHLASSDRRNESFFQHGAEKASMILASNQSYPKFTHEGLAFPQLLPTTNLSEGITSNPSILRINAVIPAVRGRLDCRMYNTTSIDAKLNGTWSVESNTSFVNSLHINITHELCKSTIEFETSTYSNTSYSGLGDSAETDNRCYDFIFIWAQLVHSPMPKISHVAAMSCYQSYDTLDVNTSLIGSDLNIDLEHPPKPLEDTKRVSTANLGVYGNFWAYLFLAQMPIDAAYLFDPFFSMLVSSRSAIPVSMLGDPTKANVVADAIQLQHSIIQTQIMYANRDSANTTNATLVNLLPNVQDGNDARTFAATVTEPTSRLRVLQDAVSMRILEALLLVSLLLLILGWVFIPKANALPDRSPTTIANMVALLAGGNILDILPEESERLSSEDVKKSMGRETTLWMGWGIIPHVEEQITDNENENDTEVSRFGIFATTPEV